MDVRTATGRGWRATVRPLRLTLLIAAGMALTPSAGSAFSSGITTLSFGPLGCNQPTCHSGGSVPVVELTGPTSVEPLSTHEYTFRVFAVGTQQFAGLNVSAPSGVLATGGANSSNTRGLNGSGGRAEITHSSPKPAGDGVVTFSFLWTAPADLDSVTLNAWGNAVNRSFSNIGDRAAFTNLTVSRAVETPTFTPTPTDTPSPTPTATPTPTVPPGTPTPTATRGACVGDCDASHGVTVDELVTGVNIALGSLAFDDCPAFDTNGDERVKVDELVGAVNSALNGCV